jgi:bacteriocin resistance YdeI/OmpD-like protein/uncharacterized protein DUF1905
LRVTLAPLSERRGGVAALRFRTKLLGTGRGGGGHLVEIPPDVLHSLGGKGRIAVNATFNGIPYRGSIVRMGGISCLGVLKATVEELGIDYGDTLEVTVEPDTEERSVEEPGDLAAALAKDAAARRAWDELSYTTRKEHARALEEAKRPETRARRLDKTLEFLASRSSR